MGGGDGLLSFCDVNAGEGFFVRLERHGRIHVGLGPGGYMMGLDSLSARAVLYRWNAVTVVFRKEAGWCDLYVNGALVNRRQFRRHQSIRWPASRFYLGKYVDGKMFREDTKAGMFYGVIKRLCLEERALSDREVRKLHGTWPVGQAAGPYPPDRRVYERSAAPAVPSDRSGEMDE